MILVLSLLFASFSPAAETPVAGVPAAAGPSCEKTGLIVPAYFDDPADWNRLYRLLARNPPGRAVVIVNPWSGPGGLRRTDQPALIAKFNARIRKIRASNPNARVIGYTGAGYLEPWRYFGFGRDLSKEKRAEAELLLRKSSPDEKRALSASVPGLSDDDALVLLAIREDIKRWHSWYPGLDGLFIDEAPTSGGLDGLGHLADFAAGLWGREPVLVYNPGTRASLSQFPRASAVCLYESSKGFDAFIQGLAPADAEKTCALLYGASGAQADKAWRDACAREVGWFYVTELGRHNPWLRLSSHLGAGSSGSQAPR